VSKGDEELAGLMRAANAGDKDAYEQLLRALLPTLRAYAGYALKRVGGDVEGEDIVQEALIAVHLKRHTWDSSEPLGPWLRAIVRHKVIDAFRRRGRRVHLPLDDFVEVLPTEEPDPQYNRRDIEKHLSSLAPRQREVVQAIALDGVSIRDTAGRLGLTEGAVRVALHRAIAALAQTFQRGVV
jgi:RNA polymerase sigma-70 factor (ECF subfamily)